MFNWKTHTAGLSVNKPSYLQFLACAAFLFFLLFTMYRGVFDNFFMDDDGKWLNRILLIQKNPSTFFQPIDGKYRPFVFLVFMLEFKCFGYNPAGYYFINFFFHFINSLLVFALTKKLCKTLLQYDLHNSVSFLTSFLFSIQMMACVPVLWISLIHDILNTTFYLLCILFYITFHESRKPFTYILSFLFFFFSLATKEVGFSLPLILLLVHVSILKEKNFKSFLLLCPFFLSDILAFPLYSQSISPSINASSFLRFTVILSSHITEAIRALFGFSQNKTLWLEPDFLPGLFQKIFIARALLITSIVFFLISTAKGFWKNKPACKAVLKTFAFGFLWIVITFLPHFPLQHLILWDWVSFSPGYHYFYLSTIGLCFSLGALMFTLSGHLCLKTNKRRTLLLSAVLFSLFLNNLFPVRHMEEVYGYHTRTIKYLLNRAESAIPVRNGTKLLLENFPSQYESLHYYSLPSLMNFFHIPFKHENIYWARGEESAQLMKTFKDKYTVVILKYNSPFNILVFKVN